jgi:hypothetical protein
MGGRSNISFQLPKPLVTPRAERTGRDIGSADFPIRSLTGASAPTILRLMRSPRLREQADAHVRRNCAARVLARGTGHRSALVVSPSSYNMKVGLARTSGREVR